MTMYGGRHLTNDDFRKSGYNHRNWNWRRSDHTKTVDCIKEHGGTSTKIGMNGKILFLRPLMLSPTRVVLVSVDVAKTYQVSTDFVRAR